MAIISSHTLNGSDGTHAGGILVNLKNLNTNEYLFKTSMDNGGRLNEMLSNESIDENANYELTFLTNDYWKKQKNFKENINIVDEIVIRFKMPNKNKKYHFPIILSHNSYSTWWSQGE
jgi:5-hydroxyisourate hydrolase-like protein (transthyretin family)|tara:strand:+ start:189 stop:542 length:354 start_codon:yes stop_codon:yes gene_type:complete